MSDKDNVPERIWYCPMCGGAAEIESNCHDDCFYEGKKAEYILKSTADKRLQKSIDANKQILAELIDSQKHQLEEILQPIVDKLKDYHELFSLGHDLIRYTKECHISQSEELVQAIKETIARFELAKTK